MREEEGAVAIAIAGFPMKKQVFIVQRDRRKSWTMFLLVLPRTFVSIGGLMKIIPPFIKSQMETFPHCLYLYLQATYISLDIIYHVIVVISF